MARKEVVHFRLPKLKKIIVSNTVFYVFSHSDSARVKDINFLSSLYHRHIADRLSEIIVSRIIKL